MTSIPPIDTYLKGALYDRLEDGDPVAPLTGPSRRGTVGKRDAARFCGSRRGRRRDRCPGPGTAGGPETDPAGATEHAHPDREETRVDQDPGEDGRRIPATTDPRRRAGATHGVPGSGVPEHLRMLGGPRGHLPHRRLPMHPPV